jgi:hypothetical protein
LPRYCPQRAGGEGLTRSAIEEIEGGVFDLILNEDGEDCIPFAVEVFFAICADFGHADRVARAMAEQVGKHRATVPT